MSTPTHMGRLLRTHMGRARPRGHRYPANLAVLYQFDGLLLGVQRLISIIGGDAVRCKAEDLRVKNLGGSSCIVQGLLQHFAFVQVYCVTMCMAMDLL